MHVTLRLSAEAHEGWVDAAHRSGVTLTALLEAAGMMMREHPGVYPPPDVVDAARMVDRERRARR